MQIALLLYDRLTALDIMGPYEVLCRIPGVDLRFVAKQPGPIRVDTGALALVADYALSDVPNPDVFVVPGGAEGTLAAMQDPEITGWVKGAHESSQWTGSVCTGSLILGAAGVLAGKKATTHWAADQMLDQLGATFTPQRVVIDGKVITAAGVSSGIDMALRLVAELTDDDQARVIQLAIEYDPQPPFQAGSPEKAGERILGLARELLTTGNA